MTGTDPSTTTVTEPGGFTRTTARTVFPDRVVEHVVRTDPSGQVVQTGDRTIIPGTDGADHIDSSTTATDPQTGDTHTQERHETRYTRDSPDGTHRAGERDATYREVDRDAAGNTTTMDGAERVDTDGNRSTTESTTDSNTGLTTVVTTTTDKEGNGTRHTTMVDPNGDDLIDETEDLSPDPDTDAAEDTDLFDDPTDDTASPDTDDSTDGADTTDSGGVDRQR